MVFRILKNYDNSGRPSGLTLDVVFHLPMYKIHKYLSEELIEAELLKYSKLIGERIHIMLIMHKIDERREYPNNLLLDEVESHSYDQSKSLSNATS
jgi:isocitrate dehydrogenase kinase/phosphatase